MRPVVLVTFLALWLAPAVGAADPDASAERDAASARAPAADASHGVLGVGLGPSPVGVRVRAFGDRSPAARAGVHVDDVIVEVAGTTVSNALDVQHAIFARAAGE